MECINRRERIVTRDWGGGLSLNDQQVDRIVGLGKWDAKESEAFRNKCKWKKQVEMGLVESKPSMLLPFTCQVVPHFMVEHVALNNLREQGHPQFWHDSRRTNELFDIIWKLKAQVQGHPDFCKKHTEETCATHCVEWSIPEEAALMGMMPPRFLSNILGDLKQNPERKWKSIRNKSEKISKTDSTGAGMCHMFEFSGTTRADTCMSNLLEDSIRKFKVTFLESALETRDEKEQAEWNMHPGMVLTNYAAFQEPHLDMPEDMREDCHIFHTPMQREGSVLSLFDVERKIHRHVHVPLGTCLALRGDVWHSGFFGNPGNIRFHMVIIRGEMPHPAKLHTLKEKNRRDGVVETRDVGHDSFEKNNDGKKKHQEFLECHERQTVLFVEAWERVLANGNDGHRMSHLLSNLDISGMKKRPANSEMI